MFSGRFEWLSALPLLIVTGALAVLAITTLAGAGSPDARARESLFDFFQRLSPPAADPGNDFHLVLIDRESVDRIGPWPWPRTILADLVSAANAAGAKGVVLVEPMDSPDPLSPETIGEFWLAGASDETLAQQLSRLPSTDKKLAEAFDKIDGAVAVSQKPPANIFRSSAYQRGDAQKANWLNVENGGAEYLALPPAKYLYALDNTLKEAAMPAVAAIQADPDGLVRRLPLLWTLSDQPAPSLSLEAARLALGESGVTAKANSSAANSSGRVLNAVSVGENTIDISIGGAMRLNFPKRLTIPATPASKLLGRGNSNRQLAGSVVFIGLDTELGGGVTTSRGVLSAAELHALAASQITSGQTPNRPGWTGYLEALGVMIFGAAAVMIAQRLDFWRAAGFASLLTIILILLSFAAFTFSNLLINPWPPAAALFVGALSVAGGSAIGGVLRDDSVRGSFHDTLPEPAMKRLRDEGGGEILQGVHREITVLSCELRLLDEDLRQLENLPDDVSRILASASIELRQTIIDTGGTADQAEGGRLFAYYGVPMEKADHAQAACAAALHLVESMDKINEDLEASSRTRGLQMHLAIGVASGKCFAGPMGHGRNNRYSAVGPAVDRAAFLRNQSEFYGPAMICDESVHRQTHHHFAYLELDKLRLRESGRPFSIYALIGNPFIKSSKGFRALDDSHRAFLQSYRTGDLAAARAMLDKAKESPGAKIALFDIYEERLRNLMEKGVPEGWDGVYEART